MTMMEARWLHPWHFSRTNSVIAYKISSVCLEYHNLYPIMDIMSQLQCVYKFKFVCFYAALY